MENDDQAAIELFHRFEWKIGNFLAALPDVEELGNGVATILRCAGSTISPRADIVIGVQALS